MRGNRMKGILAIVAALATMIVLVAVLWKYILVVLVVLSRGDSQSGVEIEGVATVNNPVVSPSGRYALRVTEEIVEGVGRAKFAIFKVSNGGIEPSPIFTANDAYRTMHRLYFLWDDQDRVWVYSGDVGTYFWERVSDDSWEKHAWAENRGVPVPGLLKELKPGYYDGS